jgi:hypothetical protein
MKKLYRLEISGWWPVTVEEEAIPTMEKPQLQALYEECEVNPYDFDGLTLQLVRGPRSWRRPPWKYVGQGKGSQVSENKGREAFSSHSWSPQVADAVLKA